MPAVAAQLEAAMASEVLSISDNGRFIRPMYAGNVLAEVELESSIKVISIRASAFAVATEVGSAAKVEEYVYNSPKNALGEVIGFDSSATGRPELADAKIVVSGGRGVQSKEGFEQYINPLADALSAAIGASRAAVDAGFAPNDWQVGQTGKTVAPQLYLAVGISGAIQHLAGMKDSKIVVAINKDPEAPIFEIADYGLVADLQKAVPELIELVKAGK
jgi:electron transfer flavoprotein alpha subunit